VAEDLQSTGTEGESGRHLVEFRNDRFVILNDAH
jgi:hypothetical protein